MAKIPKQDYIDFFNWSYDTTGKLCSQRQYDEMEKKLFGKYMMPDISQFMDDHKKDPDGAEKFAKYMLQQRPSGHIWMLRDRPKTDKEMKNVFARESKLIESAIAKIVKRVLTEGTKLGVGASELKKMQQYYRTGAKISDIEIDSYGNEFVNIEFPLRRAAPKWKIYSWSGKIHADANNGGSDTFTSLTDAFDTLYRRYGIVPASSDDIRKIQNPRVKTRESKVNKNKLTEATMGVNIPLPNCNLFVKGWGIDKQGNMRIIVGFPNDKGFPIQTNGVLPETHWVLQRAHRELSESELEEIGREVLSYVQKHGPTMVKSRLKVYNQQKQENRLTEAESVVLPVQVEKFKELSGLIPKKTISKKYEYEFGIGNRYTLIVTKDGRFYLLSGDSDFLWSQPNANQAYKALKDSNLL